MLTVTDTVGYFRNTNDFSGLIFHFTSFRRNKYNVVGPFGFSTKSKLAGTLVSGANIKHMNANPAKPARNHIVTLHPPAVASRPPTE